MKSLMTLIISIGLFLLAVIAVLAVSTPPAKACGRECDHDDHQKASIIHQDNLGKGIAIGALATCGIRLAYTRATEKRWTWCGEDKPEPLPDPGPVVKVTPDNLQDNRYLIEGK